MINVADAAEFPPVLVSTAPTSRHGSTNLLFRNLRLYVCEWQHACWYKLSVPHILILGGFDRASVLAVSAAQ
jgi:hypothetical protein